MTDEMMIPKLIASFFMLLAIIDIICTILGKKIFRETPRMGVIRSLFGNNALKVYRICCAALVITISALVVLFT